MATKTISLKAPGVREEATASEAITPGHLIEFGGSDDIQKHSSAGGDAQPLVAVENDVVGDDISTDYVSGEQVQFDAPHTGAVYLMRLADGENVTRGDFLESAGDGTVQAAGTASSSGSHVAVVGQADEDLDLSGSAGEDPANRLKVRIR